MGYTRLAVQSRAGYSEGALEIKDGPAVFRQKALFLINAICALLLPFDYPRTTLQLPFGFALGETCTDKQIYQA